jgi:hypothetical protein
MLGRMYYRHNMNPTPVFSRLLLAMYRIPNPSYLILISLQIKVLSVQLLAVLEAMLISLGTNIRIVVLAIETVHKLEC